MLTQLGHEVLLAGDGQQAIAIYRGAEKPIDLTIPGRIGGKEAVQEVIKLNKDAKVIVSSGYSNDPTMSTYKRYGFCAAIGKPHQIQQLSDVIYEVAG